ncbi:MAG TPA: hypothetical protein VJ420_08650 [Candidatus Udaeobacter sp.]|jgi:hypothetical protein|nr:hypothetical protein [Candidatus Udaeobacter sp.]
MSDFLSNLIARSFTDAPAIQPRVPSLFEASAEEFFDELPSFQGVIATPGQVAPTNASVPVSKSSAREETVTTRPIANVAATRTAERMLRRDAPAHQPAPISKSREGSAQPSGVRKLQVETKRISVAEHSFDDRKQDRAFEASSPASALQSRRRKNLLPAEREPSTASPTIRVTIGRVEVRAIHPPAPTQKEATPQPPKLSLEEYLKGSKQ